MLMRKRVLIVGGVAGGASCAARLRRLDETAEIVIFDRGPHVSFANCGLPYFVGDVITEKRKLLAPRPGSRAVASKAKVLNRLATASGGAFGVVKPDH
jgi:NADPH-dependent 2,4-dienoyl-CoA reductase/sulfur reductase-like enzyme